MKKLLKELFYIPKYGKMSEKAFLSNLSLSIIGIVLCLSTMALTAYAYFSWSLTTPTQTIQAGFYDCTVTIQAMEEDGTTVKSGVDPITLEGRQTVLDPGYYQITIQKSEGSTATTGFCMIKVVDKVYHTEQIENDSLVFTLGINAMETVTFGPSWGTSSYYVSDPDSEYYIHCGDEVEIKLLNTGVEEDTKDPSDEQTDPSESTDVTTVPTGGMEQNFYVMQEGDTLYTIEQMFGISRAKLKAYNNIEDVKTLPVGTVIYFPPEDWEIPQTTEPSTEQTEASTEATQPSTEAAEPSTEAAEPSTEPATEATQPSTEATEPSTEPVTEPTEPTEPATEPTEPATEPTEPSTEVTEPSTEVTEPSTEMTEPSTEVTEPSTEVTEPSTEVTEPSTEATESATEETESATVVTEPECSEDVQPSEE